MIPFLRALRRLFCRHRWEWFRNIHGDEIAAAGGNRSVWRCVKCGSVQYRPYLYVGTVWTPEKPRHFQWATDETDDCINRFVDRIVKDRQA